jgi:hypothetical protein
MTVPRCGRSGIVGGKPTTLTILSLLGEKEEKGRGLKPKVAAIAAGRLAFGVEDEVAGSEAAFAADEDV